MAPAKITGGSAGFMTRYWDCCKPACSYRANTIALGAPNGIAANCSLTNEESICYTDLGGGIFEESKNGCDTGGDSYACQSFAPYSVCDNLAYGFASVPGTGACGKCYQLDFTGQGQTTTKPSHQSLSEKTMIVIAVGSSYSENGQFDLLIPGGGMGAFTQGCASQWGVNANDQSTVGKSYGGFLSKCQADLGFDATMEEYKTCVSSMCTNLFGGKPQFADMLAGCLWFTDWLNAADNPSFTYKEVTCPADLISHYKSTF